LAKILVYIFRLTVARLGVAEYGLYALGENILVPLTVFSMVGLYSGIVYYVSSYRVREDVKKIKGVIYSALGITLPLGILLSVLLFNTSEWVSHNIFDEPRLTPILKYFSVAIPFIILGEVLGAVCKAFGYIKAEVFFRRLLPAGGMIFVAVASVFFGYGISGVVVGYALTAALASLGLLYFVHRRVFPLISRDDAAYRTSSLLSYSLPLFFAAFMAVLMVSVDTLMIGFYKSAEHVGLYYVAVPMARLLLIIPETFLVLFLPVITQKREMGHDICRIYLTATRWMLTLNLPLFLVLILFPTDIIHVMFGEQYVAAGKPCIVLAFGYIVFSLLLSSHYILLSFKKTREIFYLITAALALNILLNILLIPGYGILGGAIATSASLISARIFVLIIARRLTGTWAVDASCAKPLLAGLMSAGLVLFSGRLFKIPAIGQMGLLLFLYVSGMLLLRAIKEEDRNTIREILNRH